jgi:hypothetical protein
MTARYHRLIFAVLPILPLVLFAACDFGKVDQGRVVKFDRESGSVTIIRDLRNDSQNPDYSFLPAQVYTLPEDPTETGPEPKAGLRMKLDTRKNQITVYDPEAGDFETITYTLLQQKENIGKEDPAVYDASEKKARRFPVVDREKKTITVYSSRQKTFTTFSLTEKYFSLPDFTWDAGDEVRIYYKQEGKALRFMNITKTDIYKK